MKPYITPTTSALALHTESSLLTDASGPAPGVHDEVSTNPEYSDKHVWNSESWNPAPTPLKRSTFCPSAQPHQAI